METDYDDLGSRFDCACKDAVNRLSIRYKSDYRSGGPEKLSAFFELIQKEFDAVESAFIRENKIETDARALQAIRSIARSYAKSCIDDYGKFS
jgi:hypothetical protein